MNNIITATANQIVPNNQNIIDLIQNNLSAFVSCVAMIITIILFLINLFVIRRNNKVEFDRRVKLNYYEITILTAMKEIFKLITSIKKVYNELKANYHQSDPKGKLITICQKHIAIMDDHVDNIESNSLIYISVFSQEAGQQITTKISEFYDQCTDIFSKYSNPTLTNRNIDLLTSELNKHVCNVVKDTYEICRKQNP